MSDPFDDLDAETVSRIGDSFTYAPGGTGAVTLRGFVNHGDTVLGFSGPGAKTQDCDIQVRVSDVATPTKQDIITLPRTGSSYTPINWTRDPSGRWWNIPLKLVRA